MKERKLEILGILSIAISFLVIVSMLGYNAFEDPGISPNIQVENPMGILGAVSYTHLTLPTICSV